uniref:Uncharacterized protein n=1 Tax=Pyrodinium bahamense TaxID=73915 RepID=A0A7S0B6X0_9DINO
MTARVALLLVNLACCTLAIAEASCSYSRNNLMFATERFGVGTNGCRGVGECQFQSRGAAQAFCDEQSSCTLILFHRAGSDCAGWGCFTPRAGAPAENPLWERAGGGSWLKGGCEADREAKTVTPHGAAGAQPMGGLAVVLLGSPGAVAGWLASRSLPPEQRGPCIVFGTLAAMTVCCIFPHASEGRRRLCSLFAGFQVCTCDVDQPGPLAH